MGATGQPDDERSVLVALGLTPRQVLQAQLVVGGVACLAAAVVAIGLAVPASAFFPIGLASDAEIDPGVQLDLPVLALGGALAFVLLLARLVGRRA